VEMMGSKTAARKLMKRNGVPIVPELLKKFYHSMRQKLALTKSVILFFSKQAPGAAVKA